MSDATASAIFLTLQVASLATLAVFLPGMLFGYYFARRDTTTSRILSTLVTLPMVLPPTAVGYLLLRLLANDGPLGPEFFGWRIDILLTWRAAVLAAAVMAMPLVVRTAKVAFDGVDPQLEMMHRTLGYTRAETFFRASVPLASRGLLAAAILGFTRAVGEFGATVTVAGNIPFKTQTLASAIFSAQQVGRPQEAYVLIAVSLALGFGAIYATELLAARPPGFQKVTTGADILQARVSLPLDRFVLEVEMDTEAHVTGIFGPSGCGKTSFLESVAGLRPASRGRVCFGGKSSGETVWQDSGTGVNMAPELRGIGYVPQNGLLFPHLNVKQNLEAGFRRAQREGRDTRRIFDTVVQLLELDALLERHTATLSGGERQRVALGRALCSAPRLMLLDEPLAALDQSLRHRILPFLRRIRDEFDVPMLLVSHDPIEVQALCDSLLVLREGSVIARGVPRDALTETAVYPIAHERGFENIVPCTVIDATESRTRVHLGAPATDIVFELPSAKRPAGTSCLVGIPARDIILANEPPRGLSARNVHPAVVEEIYSVGRSLLLKARLAPELPVLAVEIGSAAVAELGLRAGSSVFLVIKAMSCNLYGAGDVG